MGALSVCCPSAVRIALVVVVVVAGVAVALVVVVTESGESWPVLS